MNVEVCLPLTLLSLPQVLCVPVCSPKAYESFCLHFSLVAAEKFCSLLMFFKVTTLTDFVYSQQRLLLIDVPLHNTFLELWTMVHFLIPGISRPYLSFPLKAPNEENQDYYHKMVIRLHRVCLLL